MSQISRMAHSRSGPGTLPSASHTPGDNSTCAGNRPNAALSAVPINTSQGRGPTTDRGLSVDLRKSTVQLSTFPRRRGCLVSVCARLLPWFILIHVLCALPCRLFQEPRGCLGPKQAGISEELNDNDETLAAETCFPSRLLGQLDLVSLTTGAKCS